MELLMSFLLGVVATFCMFVIGHRAAKAQTDRPRLKEIYRELLVHFESLREGLKSGRPLNVLDFDRNYQGSRPNTEAMKKEGRLHEIPPRLSSQMLQLEKDTLEGGWHFRSFAEDQWDGAVSVLTELSEMPLEDKGNGLQVGTPLRVGEGYTERPFGTLLIEEERDWLKDFLGKRSDLGIKFTLLGNDFRRPKELLIHPAHLGSGSVVDFIEEFAKRTGSKKGFQAVSEERRALLRRLDDAVDSIAERVRDPHPLWETVGSSLRELMGRRPE